MRRFSERHGLHTVSELNITPLLDLAFVLLIIFMITTPLMENNVDLVIPSSNVSPNAVNPDTVQTIAISKDSLLELNGTPTDLATLESELRALKNGRPDIAVVIRSHKDLPVQKMIDVMDVLQRAKISKVGVATSPEQP